MITNAIMYNDPSLTAGFWITALDILEKRYTSWAKY